MSRWDALKSPRTRATPSGDPITRSAVNYDGQGDCNHQQILVASDEEKKDAEGATSFYRYSGRATNWRQQQTPYSPPYNNTNPLRPAVAFYPASVGTMSRNVAPPLSYAERAWVVETLKKELLFFRGSGGLSSCPSPVMVDCVSKLRWFAVAETANVSLLLVDLLQITHADVDSFAARILEERLEATTQTSQIAFTQPQALHLIKTLSFQCYKLPPRQPLTFACILRCLALVVRSHRAFLPGEETAQTLVGGTFLPYLENDSLRRKVALAEVSSGSTTRTYRCICETTKTLLIDPKHSSALLAPLVHDISILDGKEEQAINPLRSRLLAVFAKPLVGLDKANVEEQTEACYALATAVQAIEMLDSSIGVIPGEGSSVVKSVESFVLDVLKEPKVPDSSPSGCLIMNLKSAVLRLLKGLISAYPGAVTGLGWKLMVEGCDTFVSSSLPSPTSMKKHIDKSRTCPCCAKAVFRPDSAFLPYLIHSNPTTTVDFEITVRAIQCLSGFTSALPWKIWLEKDYRSTISTTPARMSSSSGLYRRATTALDALLRIALCSFQGCVSFTTLDTLGTLIRVIFNDIPYTNAKLIQAGEDLWSALASFIFDPNANDRKRAVSNGLILASLGGTTTPKGELVPACIPALIWLLENESSSPSFIDKVLESIKNNDKASMDSLKLLAAMLRTIPELAFKRWEGFRDLLELRSSSGSMKDSVVCLELLRAFKAGKRDFGFQMKREKSKDEDVLILACLVLDRTVAHALTGTTAAHAKCRRLILDVYAAFVDEDWNLLDATEGELLHHFYRMLEWCRCPISAVQEAACKAVGEFCTQYFIASRLESNQVDTKVLQNRFIVEKVCNVMLQVRADPNPAVRSMSIFALGNLVCELRGANFKLVSNVLSVRGICEGFLEGMGDENDKVVGNSIRSLGHAGNLFVRCMVDSVGLQDSTSLSLLSRMIDSFTDRISAALDVACGLNAKSNSSLTWKQRSAAKKHGWGACHSLGLVLHAVPVEIVRTDRFLDSSCSNALKHLVLCCTHRGDLNEKVVIGAMAAIRNTPGPVLAEAGRESGLVGDALASSIRLLCDNLMVEIGKSFDLKEFKTLDDKLTKQNQLLVHHLLEHASINDASKVLKDDRISSRTLDTLYSWMVDQKEDVLHGNSFAIFALALQRPGVSTENVALEQKFASRALQKYKNEQPKVGNGPQEDPDEL
jgi:hypothetical protein